MKIAVIGGGPAGLYAASEAAKLGAETVLFEKNAVGEGIICGECIFDYFGVMKRPVRGLLFPVEKLVVRLNNIYVKSVQKYDRLWMMDRQEWQLGLKDTATKNGAVIYERCPVTADRLKKLQQEYDAVIDCSGAPSLSGQCYGFLDQYLRYFGAACQYVLEGDFSKFAGSLYTGFLPDIPRDNMPGYYWIFPKSESIANVGIAYGTNAAGRTVDLWDRLHEAMEREGLAGYKKLSKGGGFLPGRMPDRLVWNNVILAGDAAGVSSQFSGEGIDMACISGVMAARCAIEGDTNSYEEKIRKFVAVKRALDDYMCQLFRDMEFSEIDELIDIIFNKNYLKLTKMMPTAMKLSKLIWKWLGSRNKITFDI